MLKKTKLLQVCTYSKKSIFIKPKINIMKNRIPVMVVLPKLEYYNKNKIISIICDDITSAVNVMVEK